MNTDKYNLISHVGDVAMKKARENRFSPALNQAIIGERVNLEPFTFILRQNVSGAAGTWPLLEPSSDYVKGVLNIQNQAFAPNEGFLSHGIAVGYTVADISSNKGELAYDTKLAAKLRNATLIVKQDKHTVLSLPFANFVASGTATSGEELYYNFPSIRTFADIEKIDIQIEMPQGVVLTAASDATNHFLEIRMDGQQTRPKVL